MRARQVERPRWQPARSCRPSRDQPRPAPARLAVAPAQPRYPLLAGTASWSGGSGPPKVVQVWEDHGVSQWRLPGTIRPDVLDNAVGTGRERTIQVSTVAMHSVLCRSSHSRTSLKSQALDRWRRAAGTDSEQTRPADRATMRSHREPVSEWPPEAGTQASSDRLDVAVGLEAQVFGINR